MARALLSGAFARRPTTGGARRLRRGAVALFFASVTVNAALGIAALLAGEFSETHGKALGTSLSVTGALVVALACLPAWERRRLGPVPPAGALLGVVGFTLVVVGIWTETEGDPYVKTMGTALTLAVGCALACILATPTLAPRYRPVLGAALALLASAAAMTIVGIWAEPDSSWYARSLGVVGVLLAACAVSIPVLHRLGGPRPAGEGRATSFCPFCGAEHRAGPATQTTCRRCGSRYAVTSP